MPANVVIPAKAGISHHPLPQEIPASTGMTGERHRRRARGRFTPWSERFIPAKPGRPQSPAQVSTKSPPRGRRICHARRSCHARLSCHARESGYLPPPAPAGDPRLRGDDRGSANADTRGGEPDLSTVRFIPAKPGRPHPPAQVSAKSPPRGGASAMARRLRLDSARGGD